jgi:hypothetical protein
MTKPRCKWSTVMPRQMQSYSCYCRKGGPRVGHVQLQSRETQGDTLLWRPTYAYYRLPGGGGNEDTGIRHSYDYKSEAEAKRDAEDYLRSAMRGFKCSARSSVPLRGCGCGRK